MTKRKTVQLVAEPALGRVCDIFRSRVCRRSGVEFVNENADLTVRFALDASIGSQGFRIEEDADGITVLGDGLPGLLAGVGKFLRTSTFRADGMTPSAWRGTSIPTSMLRGIQIDIHFCNFYHMASAEELAEYVEDLALWGINCFDIQFPLIDFCGWDDPEIERIIRQMKAVLDVAKPLDLEVGMEVVPNQDFVTFREEFAASPNFDPTGRRGDNGHNICPNKPGAMEYILTQTYGKVFPFLKERDIELDFLCFWPYDEGGCSCEKCRPWGANGYLKVSRAVLDKAREYMPDIKVILSTWVFDTPEEGEWEGLTAALKDKNDWVDYILADSHTDFPRYPLTKGVPGNLPLLNYPEISMWGLAPWGGYGANPLPERFERLWRQVQDHVSGGIAYSEGIFDDVNKVVVSQFYWNKNTTAEETLQEYIRYEMDESLLADIRRIIRIIEDAHVKTAQLRCMAVTAQICENAAEAVKLAQKVRQALPTWAAEGWRWRILDLRTQMDLLRYTLAWEKREEVTIRTSWTDVLRGSEEARKVMLQIAEIFHSNLDYDRDLHPMFQHLRPALLEI